MQTIASDRWQKELYASDETIVSDQLIGFLCPRILAFLDRIYEGK